MMDIARKGIAALIAGTMALGAMCGMAGCKKNEDEQAQVQTQQNTDPANEVDTQGAKKSDSGNGMYVETEVDENDTAPTAFLGLGEE
jgi:hypothetical protein